jgi:2-polyprenyl-6-methoxyphenol hydroxylase-like FAD-dependent oxidoreductase
MVADIAIVGGGPSGLALAGMLERAGFSYVVYERSAHDVPPRGGCLDLHPGSGQVGLCTVQNFESCSADQTTACYARSRML